MKTLIVEDDFSSRMLLQELLKKYGPTHVAVNGKEAAEAVALSLEAGEGYNLICLDIMMPEMDGQEALREIRKMEEEKGIISSRGARIIMTTALNRVRDVAEAYSGLCDAYLTKPLDKEELKCQLVGLGLIRDS